MINNLHQSLATNDIIKADLEKLSSAIGYSIKRLEKTAHKLQLILLEYGHSKKTIDLSLSFLEKNNTLLSIAHDFESRVKSYFSQIFENQLKDDLPQAINRLRSELGIFDQMDFNVSKSNISFIQNHFNSITHQNNSLAA